MSEIVITVHVKKSLINETDSKDDWSPEQRLVDEVLDGLPKFACDTINDAQRASGTFARALGHDNVRLLLVPVYDRSKLTYDLSIDIRFGGIVGDKEAPQERRWATAREVSGMIFQLLDADDGHYMLNMRHGPSYLVECTLLPSSGIVRTRGGNHHKWGTPDYGAPRPHYVPDRDEGRGDNSDDDPYHPPIR